jgi:hypothetical protein
MMEPEYESCLIETRIEINPIRSTCDAIEATLRGTRIIATTGWFYEGQPGFEEAKKRMIDNLLSEGWVTVQIHHSTGEPRVLTRRRSQFR